MRSSSSRLGGGAPLALAVLVVLARGSAAPAQPSLETYETKYYKLATDLDQDGARAAIRHITLMAEEYYERTRGFGKTVNERLPIFILRSPATYRELGGMPGTAGVFIHDRAGGDRLMAMVRESDPGESWHVIQHEGFHQFSAASIGRDLPPWVNEGLAEYFGEGVFTGDAFYTGFVPQERLADIRAAIRAHKLRPLEEMMQMSHEIWNSTIGLAHDKAGTNYNQAWAMVQFLAHGDDGRYQEAFGNFLTAVSRKVAWEKAWIDCFGADIPGFQERFNQYWLGLPEHPTAVLEAQALVSTITSFYARAFSQRQYFETFEEFKTAAAASELKANEEDWLPPEMLEVALKRVDEAGEWSLRRKGQQAVICELADGTVLEGRFQVANRRVKSVEVLVKPVKKRK